MKLYRYELYRNGEPQNIGFIAGLNQIICKKECKLTDMQIDMLLEPFDVMLPLPKNVKRDTASFFTEFGRLVLFGAISRIADIYSNGEFNVREIVVELPDDELDKIEYRDEYQAYLRLDMYERLKANRYMMCV